MGRHRKSPWMEHFGVEEILMVKGIKFRVMGMRPGILVLAPMHVGEQIGKAPPKLVDEPVPDDGEEG